MKYFIIPVLSLLGFSCAQSETPNSDQLQGDMAQSSNTEILEEMPEADTEDTEWSVIFEDYFQGDSRIPDENKWVLCKRGHDSWNRYLSESYDQAYQQDGILYLVAERKDGEYLTGGIETLGKFDFQYGKVECRARFARTPQGNHTGIWMMPAPPAEQWPKSGEIDIMEHLGDSDIIYETVHSWYLDDLNKEKESEGRAKVELEDKGGWNIYGLIWTPESISFTVNGEVRFTYDNANLEGEDGMYQWPFDHPFYLILSQSLGGEGTWAGPIDNDELPSIFEIDWIRVLQKDEGAGVPQVRL